MGREVGIDGEFYHLDTILIRCQQHLLALEELVVSKIIEVELLGGETSIT